MDVPPGWQEIPDGPEGAIRTLVAGDGTDHSLPVTAVLTRETAPLTPADLDRWSDAVRRALPERFPAGALLTPADEDGRRTLLRVHPTLVRGVLARAAAVGPRPPSRRRRAVAELTREPGVLRWWTFAHSAADGRAGTLLEVVDTEAGMYLVAGDTACPAGRDAAARRLVLRWHIAPEHRPAGTIAGVSDERGTTAGTTGATDEGPAGPEARPATFRAVPMSALIAVGFVAICVSPIAFLGGPWFLVFLLPLALGWWVVRTRTTVDVEALRVRSVRGSQRVAWDDVATLRVVERGWVRAVRGDESELALVGVRTRDLGRVAQASRGRITMPTPEEVEDAAAHQRELEATRMRIARLREAEQETEQEAEQDTDRDAADATPGEGSERA